jgi:nucleoside-diphosphate-sugar epimerase
VAENLALIAGATGAVGERVVDVLAATPGWQVVGLCRNPPENAPGNVRYVKTDLLDAESCHQAVAAAGAVTHMVYCSRSPFGEGGVEDVPSNVAMFRHVLEASDVKSLRHVHLVAGGKWYGLHMGPFRTPADENDPRHIPPNFYYDQQDFMSALRAKRDWSWSSSRPNVIVDVAPGRGRNLISLIGAYAAICRETGAAFDFLGKPGCYDTLFELTDATLLARSIQWMLTDPRAADQAFNITNGDVFRWSRIWPMLAKYFGLECGIVRNVSMEFWLRGKEAVWDGIVQKYQLRPLKMEQVARWAFGDFVFGMDYDVISSMNRARLAGFQEMEDTPAMFLRHLNAYRAARVLP